MPVTFEHFWQNTLKLFGNTPKILKKKKKVEQLLWKWRGEPSNGTKSILSPNTSLREPQETSGGVGGGRRPSPTHAELPVLSSAVVREAWAALQAH